MTRDGGGDSAARGCGIACVERSSELHAAELEAVCDDEAVVQDERDLRIGGELRESAGFVCGCDREGSDTEVREVVEGVGSCGTGERVSVGGDGVVAIEDNQAARNRLRDGRGDLSLRLCGGDLGGICDRECEQDGAAKHAKHFLAAVAARLCIGPEQSV